MVDVNPEIWENETLGAAAYNERLDRLEKQQHEDRIARVEGREPREVVVDNTYPGFKFDQNQAVPSNATVIHFADEQPHEVVQTGNDVIPEGMDEETDSKSEESDSSPTIEEDDPNGEDDSIQGSDESADDESGPSVDSPPEEEGNSTQWN